MAPYAGIGLTLRSNGKWRTWHQNDSLWFKHYGQVYASSSLAEQLDLHRPGTGVFNLLTVIGRCRILAFSGQIWPGKIWPGEIWPGEIWPGEIWPGEIWRDSINAPPHPEACFLS